MADVEQEAIAVNDSESAGAMVESAIRGFLGDPFGKASEIMDAQGDLQKTFKEAAQQVKQTFHRVEEIAVARSGHDCQRSRFVVCGCRLADSIWRRS